MSLDMATAFNLAMMCIAGLGGWFVKTLFDRIQHLEDAIGKLREELPDRYVRRDDNREALDNIFSMLRRIEDKLDSKADKS